MENKCWICKRTRAELTSDIMELEKKQSTDGIINSEKAIGEEAVIEFIDTAEASDLSFCNYPVCRSCQDILLAVTMPVMRQYLTEEQFEDYVKKWKERILNDN